MTPEEGKTYEANVARLRAAMDAGALEEAWQVGREMDLDTAVSYALSDGERDDG
jgi:hypothetical protein